MNPTTKLRITETFSITSFSTNLLMTYPPVHDFFPTFSIKFYFVMKAHCPGYKNNIRIPNGLIFALAIIHLDISSIPLTQQFLVNWIL